MRCLIHMFLFLSLGRASPFVSCSCIYGRYLSLEYWSSSFILQSTAYERLVYKSHKWRFECYLIVLKLYNNDDASNEENDDQLIYFRRLFSTVTAR